jgi:hypothetical protein
MARSARYQARRRRLGFAKSQQFDHALSALPQIVGARIDCRGLTNEARVRRRREADRPDRSPYGRIKAARCGPVGRVKQVGISAPWHEVHFARQPASSENVKKINAWLTSRAVAWSTSAAGRSVAPRILRPFCSTRVPWHTVAMARPHKSRQLTGQLRSSAGNLASGRA